MPGISSDEDKILIARITDICEAVGRQYLPKFSFFLDERQMMLAKNVLARENIRSYAFFGGHDGAKRAILGVFPEDDAVDSEKFPLMALKFSYRGQDKLSHKDFLGAIMSQQVRRETLGDILVNDGETVVFAFAAVVELLLGLEKIGSVGVRVSVTQEREFAIKENFLEIAGTVPSMRLDAVASVAIKQSREKVQLFIKANGIDMNHEKIFSASAILKEGDTFSIRGQGKFLLSQIGGKSKKERYHIIIQKYI